MGKCEVVGQLDAVALANAEGGRAPFADAVQGEDRGLVEGAGEEGAGGVAFVVIGEERAGARHRFARASAIVWRMCSFVLSHTGMARRKLAKPRGANAR